MLDAHVRKRRRDLLVDVALTAARGARVGLFGASGAGKSTVLSCIAGLETPDAGHVRLGDLVLHPLPLHARPVGYLTQDAALFPHLTVGENVRFGLARGVADDAWVAELRERLGLAPLWDARATEISGGQARRVALARMFARRPRLVLLDEPFAGLDRAVVRGLLDDLLAWQARLGFTLLAVDHQAAVLERLCPDVIAIEDGCVVQRGSWEALRAAPATPLLAALLAPL